MPPALLYVPITIGGVSADSIFKMTVAMPLRCAMARLADVSVTLIRLDGAWDFATAS
jgi:hypothetical protein